MCVCVGGRGVRGGGGGGGGLNYRPCVKLVRILLETSKFGKYTI